jgi:hypothetical protein
LRPSEANRKSRRGEALAVIGVIAAIAAALAAVLGLGTSRHVGAALLMLAGVTLILLWKR